MRLKSKLLKLPVSAFIFTLSTILVTVFILSIRPVPPVADQLWLITSHLSSYPAFSNGISSNLIAGLVNLVQPSSEAISSLIVRILSGVLFIVSSTLVAWDIFSRYKMRFAFFPFVAFVFLSRFPFLWLSSELLGGAFLMFSIWSYFTHRHFLLTSAFLVLYCLAKPDLIFSGVILAGYMVWFAKCNPLNKTTRALIFSVLLFVFLLPGLIRKCDRQDVSFGQHYALLIHEIAPSTTPATPWLSWPEYVNSDFGTSKLSQIVRTHPDKYVNYLFLSLSKSFRNMALSGALLFLIITLAGQKNEEITLSLIVFFSSLLPIILFAFLHIRYQARFYPLLVITSFLATANFKPIIRNCCILFFILLFLAYLHSGTILPAIFGVDY